MAALARAVYAARDDALRVARAPLNFHHHPGRKRENPAILILTFGGFVEVLRPVMNMAGEGLTGGQGGRGGGLAKARVCSRSCQEGKIRKVVMAARLLKNWLREPSCFRAISRIHSATLVRKPVQASSQRTQRDASGAFRQANLIHRAVRIPLPLTESTRRTRPTAVLRHCTAKKPFTIAPPKRMNHHSH
jgi:hypothetical protein